MRTPSDWSKSTIVPSFTLLATPSIFGRSASRMPRTRTPLEVAVAARQRLALRPAAPPTTTPGTLAMRSATSAIVGQLRIHRLNHEVSVEPENLVDQLRAEPVHHRHDDDQRRDPDHDAEQREDRDDQAGGRGGAGGCSARQASTRSARTVVCRSGSGFASPVSRRRRASAQPATSRFAAASIETVSRWPVARRLISTSPRSSALRTDDQPATAARSGPWSRTLPRRDCRRSS